MEVQLQTNTLTETSPWLQNKAWQSPRIASGARKAMFGLWVFAALWNGISSPILFELPEELNNGNYALLVGLLFPAAGLFLVVKAAQATREWRRFGRLAVVMDPFPGAIGGQVGGHLDIRNPHEANAEYRVTLECVYTYVSGSGKNRSRRERIEWGERGNAGVASLGDRLRLSFCFDVPDNLPQADIKQSGDYYFWRLTFTADIAGADLNRQFNIPVFKTGERSQSILNNISAQVQARREQEARESQALVLQGRFDETALAGALRYRQENGEHRFYYPMFRNKLLTLFALIFAGGFGFAVYGMHTAFSGGWLGILITLFSLPFALVALVAGIAAVYLPLNNLSVSVGRGKLRVWRRLFIVPVYHTVLRANDVKAFTIKRSGSTGQGADKVEHFKIRAVTHKNKTVTVAEDVDGEDLANQFKDFLAQRLGIA